MIATDTIHAIPVSLLGGLSYLVLELADLKILGLLLIGSIPATLSSGFPVARLSTKIIRSILATILILATIKLFDI